MELFMRNVDWNVNKAQLSAHLANLLHGPAFTHLSPTAINFHLRLHPDKKNRIHEHGGTGALTLPSVDIGNHFLHLFGSQSSQFPVTIGKKTIIFSISKNPEGLGNVVENVTLRPYQQPWLVEQRERRSEKLTAGRISIKKLQFGWECRDYVFSIESEEPCEGRASLSFGDERRELRIELQQGPEKYFIVINYSHLNNIFVHNYLDVDAAIVFSLNTPPAYERAQRLSNLRERLSFLPIPDHERVAPYASLAIRLVCESVNDLREFRQLSVVAQIHKISPEEYPVDHRDLFSSVLLQTLQTYLRKFNWCVAFQIEAIVRSLVVDMKEMLDIMPSVVRIYKARGKEFTAAVLRRFAVDVKRLFDDGDGADEYDGPADISQCLLDSEKEVSKRLSLETLKPTEGSLCDAFHVSITPTTMHLDGPFPERSNRVIRDYDPIHQESFLRVSFVDEGRSRYRFDREVDGPAFVRSRVGPFLLTGLTIGYRIFHFLAYSQSALKEHAVWFVKPFRCSKRGIVTAETIIKSLGTFDVDFDRNLIRCPARYAARISQAFTATDSVEIEVEEILPIDDICTVDNKYQFTDGVGTMSKELAQEVWKELKKTKRRGRVHKGAPSAYQVRFMGSKGMLSVDYKLRGFVICLRPSMIKFEAAEWNNIEVARAFDRPGLYYLNRPLIMLLEGLGVPFEIFKHYQDNAVYETREAAQSLGQAARLLEKYGLGTSYRLPSIMHNLDKLGVQTLPGDDFYTKVVEYSVHHILRDLKNHARIPVPGAWTLVGVADVHGYLGPKEIFACIKPVSGKTIYLEGPVLISRSPTIHPGDVMIVNAIGRPPPGCCFAAEPLPNTVVFSILGERPIPSCLGGGDLDGDVYNLIPLNDLPDFEPSRRHPPADYSPAPKRLLDRPSNMNDVAEFVMEYINSDVVGIIAINWLITADISRAGIFDPDCMKLANLHSDAVDYPKSGQPVSLKAIPKLPSRMKPDWNAPETVLDTSDFYPSQRAIGHLFRAIDLPIEHIRSQLHPRRRRNQRGPPQNQVIDGLTDGLNNLSLSVARNSYVFSVVEDRVQEFIDTEIRWPTTEDQQENTSQVEFDLAAEVDFITQLYNRYRSELRGHCAANTLSHARHAQLSEEEAVVGTIIQKTSNRRKRKDAMTKLRESTDHLVRAIREDLEGDDDISNLQYLERAWLSWDLSILERSSNDSFGAASFGWIALAAIFDAIGKLEESLQ